MKVCIRIPGWSVAGNWLLFVCLVFCFLQMPADAIIFYSTSNPDFNAAAPTGALAGSGWQFEGTWGSFIGTVIAPHYFITAKHVQASVGDWFQFQNQSYQTVAFYDDPSTDLRICQVCGTFPLFVPLYTSNDEPGRGIVAFGRGTRRGAAVYVSGVLKGWKWGSPDGYQRWGENTVNSITNRGGVEGELLKMSFDASVGTTECQLSVGDSGGGVFINDGSGWKLAGVNYDIDGPYNTNTVGSGFDAAIFDERNLYVGHSGAWTRVPNTSYAQPGCWYATRISSRIAWINSILSQPAPSDDMPLLEIAWTVGGAYTTEWNAQVDAVAHTITIPKPTRPSFYRLRACHDTRLTSVRATGTSLVLTFQ